MGMSIDDKIHHLQTLRNVWKIELRHSFNTTEKEINQGIVDSLDSAIDTIRKYQKIEELYDYWRNGKCEYTISCMENIGKVLRDGNDD